VCAQPLGIDPALPQAAAGGGGPGDADTRAGIGETPIPLPTRQNQHGTISRNYKLCSLTLTYSRDDLTIAKGFKQANTSQRFETFGSLSESVTSNELNGTLRMTSFSVFFCTTLQDNKKPPHFNFSGCATFSIDAVYGLVVNGRKRGRGGEGVLKEK
jgi:hypothetical protein